MPTSNRPRSSFLPRTHQPVLSHHNSFMIRPLRLRNTNTAPERVSPKTPAAAASPANPFLMSTGSRCTRILRSSLPNSISFESSRWFHRETLPPLRLDAPSPESEYQRRTSSNSSATSQPIRFALGRISPATSRSHETLAQALVVLVMLNASSRSNPLNTQSLTVSYALGYRDYAGEWTLTSAPTNEEPGTALFSR